VAISPQFMKTVLGRAPVSSPLAGEIERLLEAWSVHSLSPSLVRMTFTTPNVPTLERGGSVIDIDTEALRTLPDDRILACIRAFGRLPVADEIRDLSLSPETTPPPLVAIFHWGLNHTAMVFPPFSYMYFRSHPMDEVGHGAWRYVELPEPCANMPIYCETYEHLVSRLLHEDPTFIKTMARNFAGLFLRLNYCRVGLGVSPITEQEQDQILESLLLKARSLVPYRTRTLTPKLRVLPSTPVPWGPLLFSFPTKRQTYQLSYTEPNIGALLFAQGLSAIQYTAPRQKPENQRQ